MMAAPHSPSADPRDRLEFAENAFRADGWFDLAHLDESWPLTSKDAAALLCRGGEYDVDVDALEDLVSRKLTQVPGVGEAGFEWNAEDILAAVYVLEGRQQWTPTPSKHDCKKHSTRLLLEQARADGTLADIAHGGLIRFDLRHLIALLVAMPHHEARVKTAALLEAILEVDHGVVV